MGPIKTLLPFDHRIFASLSPGAAINCIFDVGANVGQTARRARESFPDATIYSFEPIPSTFDVLQGNIAAMPNSACIEAHCLALGDERTTATVYLKELHSQMSLTRGVNKPIERLGGAAVVVSVIPLWEFARDRGIDAIDILKMDVEGYELAVLRGALPLLPRQITFVIAEVNFSPTDRRQSYFPDIERFLTPFGFEPFGIYDVHYRENDGRLDYCDALFVNRETLGRKLLSGSSEE